MKEILPYLLVFFTIAGCSSKPYVPSEEELFKRKCREVTSSSNQSLETKSALRSYYDGNIIFDINMKSIESSVEKGGSISSYNLEQVESLYKAFTESNRRLEIELGECYPELIGYTGIKENILRFENMPEEAKKALRNEKEKKLARIERDKKVEEFLKNNVKPFKTSDVEVSIIQVKGKTAIFEVKAVGNKIVRYNTRKVWQDQITGEIKSVPSGFSLVDNHGNSYYLRKIVLGELSKFNLEAYSDSIRPDQKIILTVVFSDWPVNSEKLTLKVSPIFIGSEIVFEIPTEIWKLTADYSNLEK